jgi:hypothetical protein
LPGFRSCAQNIFHPASDSAPRFRLYEWEAMAVGLEVEGMAPSFNVSFT